MLRSLPLMVFICKGISIPLAVKSQRGEKDLLQPNLVFVGCIFELLESQLPEEEMPQPQQPSVRFRPYKLLLEVF
ncbi:hypothetical protein P3L10_024087 [Capsicum annuum]